MNSNSFTSLRFAIAGILSVVAAYFTEKTIGAIAGIPIIIVLCAIAYIIYRNPVTVVCFCTLGGIIFKFLFTQNIRQTLTSAVICAIFSLLAVVSAHYIFFKEKKYRKDHVPGFIILLLSFLLYSEFFGTFYGNLSSKRINENFIREEYPDAEFTIGCTYYSAFDHRYVTEAVFNDNEVYTALFSAAKNGDCIINGYRDYCEARLLESGTERLKSFLESYGHEGEDFALRRKNIETADKLTSKSKPSDYYKYMVYEIAFYDVFQTPQEFTEKCMLYTEYIPDAFKFESIRFYGIGNSGKFEYQADYSGQKLLPEVYGFDKRQFKKYSSDKDTHRYWSIIK